MKSKMKKIAASVAAIGLVSIAHAGSIELETTPTINVNAGCGIDVVGDSTIDFGTVHHFTKASEVAPVVKNVRVSCTNGLPYTLNAYSITSGLPFFSAGQGGVVPHLVSAGTPTTNGDGSIAVEYIGKGGVAEEIQISYQIKKGVGYGGATDYEDSDKPFQSADIGTVTSTENYFSKISVSW